MKPLVTVCLTFGLSVFVNLISCSEANNKHKVKTGHNRRLVDDSENEFAVGSNDAAAGPDRDEQADFPDERQEDVEKMMTEAQTKKDQKKNTKKEKTRIRNKRYGNDDLGEKSHEGKKSANLPYDEEEDAPNKKKNRSNDDLGEKSRKVKSANLPYDEEEEDAPNKKKNRSNDDLSEKSRKVKSANLPYDEAEDAQNKKKKSIKRKSHVIPDTTYENGESLDALAVYPPWEHKGEQEIIEGKYDEEGQYGSFKPCAPCSISVIRESVSESVSRAVKYIGDMNWMESFENGPPAFMVDAYDAVKELLMTLSEAYVNSGVPEHITSALSLAMDRIILFINDNNLVEGFSLEKNEEGNILLRKKDEPSNVRPLKTIEMSAVVAGVQKRFLELADQVQKNEFMAELKSKSASLGSAIYETGRDFEAAMKNKLSAIDMAPAREFMSRVTTSLVNDPLKKMMSRIRGN